MMLASSLPEDIERRLEAPAKRSGRYRLICEIQDRKDSYPCPDGRAPWTNLPKNL